MKFIVYKLGSSPPNVQQYEKLIEVDAANEQMARAMALQRYGNGAIGLTIRRADQPLQPTIEQQ